MSRAMAIPARRRRSQRHGHRNVSDGHIPVHLHKSKRLEVPRAETQSHYILMGLDADLNQAMKKAVQETVKFLVEEKGLNRTDAYSFAQYRSRF